MKLSEVAGQSLSDQGKHVMFIIIFLYDTDNFFFNGNNSLLNSQV